MATPERSRGVVYPWGEFPWTCGPPKGMKIASNVAPAKAGVHLAQMDSRLRGNDVIFEGSNTA